MATSRLLLPIGEEVHIPVSRVYNSTYQNALELFRRSNSCSEAMRSALCCVNLPWFSPDLSV